MAPRLRLSVDSSHRVTCPICASSHHRSSSLIRSAPTRWPSFGSTYPISLAHRRLPSHMIPTWRGWGLPTSPAAIRRSYTEYTRSRRLIRGSLTFGNLTLGSLARRRFRVLPTRTLRVDPTVLPRASDGERQHPISRSSRENHA